MGFFSKLFEKKECAICGGEIGLLGNRKLEDGNMCKNCAAKLSPWFSDRRESTVEEIAGQLEYRERNREELKSFRADKTFGRYYRMLVEEENSVPVRFVVTREQDFAEANADIVRFTDVTACCVDIQEHSEEQKRRNEDNELVSYNPPRYLYQYDFYVELTIANNPYFDEMKFKLNRDSVDIEVNGRSGIGRIASSGEFDPADNSEYSEYKAMCDELEKTVACGQKGEANVKFEDALLSALGQLAGQTAAPQKPTKEPETAPAGEARPKFCPECGAPTTGGKFCANCGSKL